MRSRKPARLLALLLLFGSTPGYATGTAAGTVITNTTTLNYSVEGVAAPSITSAPATVVVDELIDLVLTWQDGAPVLVTSPDVDDPLTFLLTNTGNGAEAFGLTRNNTLAGDGYNPLDGSAGANFLENGLAAGFQVSGPNADTLYVAGSNDPNLAADASQTIYVVSNTPGSVSNNSTGLVELVAASRTPGAAGAAPGTDLPGLGQGGVTAVVGTRQAQANSTGSYIVSSLSVSVAKSVLSVVDPQGGSTLGPGAVITYRLQVTVSGSGVADSLLISDPMPAEVTYAPNSITVGGSPRTDAIDADNSQFSANTVTVSLGNVPAPGSYVVEFRATLN